MMMSLAVARSPKPQSRSDPTLLAPTLAELPSIYASPRAGHARMEGEVVAAAQEFAIHPSILTATHARNPYNMSASRSAPSLRFVRHPSPAAMGIGAAHVLFVLAIVHSVSEVVQIPKIHR